ncbi:MAG: LytR/AlgR family response regulator transcription factor [Carnobacterium maltaromaticum]
MLNIAICDDESSFLERAEHIILSCPNTKFDVDVYTNSHKLYSNLKKEKYDIYFLDIDMPNLDGISLAEKIREKDDYAILIFFTSHREYMENVFKVQPFDYLLKPLDRKTTWETLTKAIRHLNEHPNQFSYINGKTDFVVATNDIFFFEKQKRKVIMHGKMGEQSFYMDTKTLLQKLGEDFVQIHTSYIVNSYYTHAIKKRAVVVQTNNGPKELPISGKFQKSCKNQILAMLGV